MTAAACDELEGKTATGKSIDPMLCSNQTFWEKTSCGSEIIHRCTGDRPGQCGLGDDDFNPCTDGSSEIKPAEDGDCGEENLVLDNHGFDNPGKEDKACVEKKWRCADAVKCAEEDLVCCLHCKRWKVVWGKDLLGEEVPL